MSNKGIVISFLVLICCEILLVVLDLAGFLNGVIDVPVSTYFILVAATSLVALLLALPNKRV